MGKKKHSLRKKQFKAQRKAEYHQNILNHTETLRKCAMGSESYSLQNMLPHDLKLTALSLSEDQKKALILYFTHKNKTETYTIATLTIAIIKAMAWNLEVLGKTRGESYKQKYMDLLKENMGNVLPFEGAFLSMLDLMMNYKKRDFADDLFLIEKINNLFLSGDDLHAEVSVLKIED